MSNVSTDQIKLVLDNIIPAIMNVQEVSRIFYQRLFADAPHLSELFRDVNAEGQSEKMTQMLLVIFREMQNLSKASALLKSLAKSHNRYGVDQADYPVVGEALTFALKSVLGRDWTPELQAAWASVYGELAQLMEANM